MVLRCPAKLNLFLAVINKRKDNYHNIKTIFERIGLSDKIIIKVRSDNKIKINCSDPAVPEDKTNLCYKSALLLRKKFGLQNGLDIRIIKRIPVGAGLGGGSSDAAGVLMGLNRLWRLHLDKAKLCSLGAKIGSDVPFFIHNTKFALGTGRGEKIKPIRMRSFSLWHVVIVPRIKVSSAFIYRKWDKFSGLTSRVSDVRIPYNDLQNVTFRLYPQLKKIKHGLRSCKAQSISMSGSGPAVFSVVSSRKEALRIASQLKRGNKSWRVFVTKTL